MRMCVFDGSDLSEDEMNAQVNIARSETKKWMKWGSITHANGPMKKQELLDKFNQG